jgi:hypothetical protein
VDAAVIFLLMFGDGQPSGGKGMCQVLYGELSGSRRQAECSIGRTSIFASFVRPAPPRLLAPAGIARCCDRGRG